MTEDTDVLCRYCLRQDPSESLIAPCSCSGSQKFVHKICLKTWLESRWHGSDLENPGDSKGDPAICEVCLQKFSGSWKRKFKPRLTWRDGISGPYKCFLVTILTFNAICFAYSCMHLALLACLVPKNISSPPTTAFYWLIVGSVMTFFIVLILLMVMDRCPWVRLQSHQWRWSFSESDVQLA